MLSRRRAMVVLGAAMAIPLVPRSVLAGVARGLPLEDLVRRSAHVLRGTPLEAYSEWARFGGGKRIVTYTRLRVDEPVAGSPEAEVLVRTLGGVVGELGQVVHGEASLLVGEPCLAFLKQLKDGPFGVTAMAQGHYPLKSDPQGVLRVTPSPQLSVLLEKSSSAVAKLSGLRIDEAKTLVRRAVKP